MGYPHYTGDDEDWGDGGRRCASYNGPPPRIVCLCGSTRFFEQFMEQNYRLTMAGNIVLSVGFFSHRPETYSSEEVHAATPEEKIALDELHKRKIDLAHEIFVINVDGYVGESTTSEILYAERYGKKITFLEPHCFTLPNGDCIGTGCMHDVQSVYDSRGDC